MLEVLKVKELKDVLAVVTRYFGGTKLGAGGLIRAYSSSVSESLEHIGLVKGMLQQELIVTTDYPNHGKLEYFLQQENITLLDTQFTDKVMLTIMVDEEETTEVQAKIVNLLSNQCDISIGDVRYIEKEI